MKDEGIEFRCGVAVGDDVSFEDLKAECDALIVAVGATVARDLPIPGRQLNGVMFAMEFLTKNTQSLMDSNLEDGNYVSAKGKKVIVIGGGDTGNDCIGTSVRHGATSVINFELLQRPPATRAPDNPWPQWPRTFKIDYGHAEVQAHFGYDPRQFAILSKVFVDDGNGNVKGIRTVRLDWHKNEKGQWTNSEVPDSEEFFPADLVFLSMGFLGPDDCTKGLGLKRDGRTNIQTPQGSYATSVKGVFAAGDCRRGQSLIVWGIQEGRQCAREVDEFLMQTTRLPGNGGIQVRSLKSIESPLPPVSRMQTVEA